MNLRIFEKKIITIINKTKSLIMINLECFNGFKIEVREFLQFLLWNKLKEAYITNSLASQTSSLTSVISSKAHMAYTSFVIQVTFRSHCN